MLNKTDRELAKAYIKPLLEENLRLYRAAWHGSTDQEEILRKEYQVFCRKTEDLISSILEDFGLENTKISLAGTSPTYLHNSKVKYLTSLWV